MLHDTTESGDAPNSLAHFKIINVVVLDSFCFSSSMQLWVGRDREEGESKIQCSKSYSGVTEEVLYH